MQEVEKALNMLKTGKVTEIDEITRKIIKMASMCDGMAMEDMLYGV